MGIINKVKKVIGAPFRAIAKGLDERDAALEDKEVRDIERAFGSVENYKALNPMFRTRKEMHEDFNKEQAAKMAAKKKAMMK